MPCFGIQSETARSFLLQWAPRVFANTVLQAVQTGMGHAHNYQSNTQTIASSPRSLSLGWWGMSAECMPVGDMGRHEHACAGLVMCHGLLKSHTASCRPHYHS